VAGLDRRLILHFDWTVFWSVLTLAGIGLLSVMSASYAGPHEPLDPLVIRQMIWVGAGTLVMIGAVLVDYRALETYAYPLYVIALALLAVAAVTGHATG